MVLPDELHLESLEVGAAPLVRHFLHRLDLHGLFERHLPVLPGRLPALPSATVLCLLVTNLLLARQPLYALPHWAARWAPEFLGLQPGQAALLNDDRLGRAHRSSPTGRSGQPAHSPGPTGRGRVRHRPV